MPGVPSRGKQWITKPSARLLLLNWLITNTIRGCVVHERLAPLRLKWVRGDGPFPLHLLQLFLGRLSHALTDTQCFFVSASPWSLSSRIRVTMQCEMAVLEIIFLILLPNSTSAFFLRRQLCRHEEFFGSGERVLKFPGRCSKSDLDTPRTRRYSNPI